MKRTVLRPQGPATAATNARPPATRPGKAYRLTGEQPPIPEDNRITLAVLEHHTLERGRGYDPYNAGASPMDVQAWKRRRKPG